MRKVFRSEFVVTQHFGARPEYYSKFGLQGHEGIDLIPSGSVWDVHALEDGVVVKDEDNPRSGAYGVYVTIWHPNIRKATQYAHLKENFVSNGDQVKRGQKIGTMGATGNVTGAHLHLNLFNVDSSGFRLDRNNGFLGGINPISFLSEDVDGSQPSEALDECLKQHEKLVTEANQREENIRDLVSEIESRDGRIKSFEDFQLDLAGKLGTNNQQSDILGEIDNLVSKEDRLAEAVRAREKAEEALIEVQTRVTELENQHDDDRNVILDLSEKIKEQDEEIKKLHGDIQKYQGASDFEPLFTIFGIYFCKKK